MCCSHTAFLLGFFVFEYLSHETVKKFSLKLALRQGEDPRSKLLLAGQVLNPKTNRHLGRANQSGLSKSF